MNESGIKTPRSIFCSSKEQIIQSARDFKKPFITKHNRAGRGLGVKLFNNQNELEQYVKGPDFPTKGIIIGNPLNMDGSLGSSAQSVKDISNNIENSINLPICLWDERLSTVGAFNLSSQLDINVSKREKKIDENAAAFILQGALDFLNN